MTPTIIWIGADGVIKRERHVSQRFTEARAKSLRTELLAPEYRASVQVIDDDDPRAQDRAARCELTGNLFDEEAA